MKLLSAARRLVRRIGLDIAPWPHRPEVGAIDWALAEVLRSRAINCAIDVGGNRGHFARRLRSLGYAGRIVSFEPSPSVLPDISAAAARDPDWIVRPLALSSQPGRAALRLHKGPELDSLHDALPGVVEQIPIMEETGIATITLSTLEAEIPAAIAGIGEPRVLIKSDTQGHEVEVLRGAGAHGLGPEVVAVLVELAAQPIYHDQPKMTMVMDLVMDDGFTAVAFEPLFQSSDGLRIVELDALFLRPQDAEPDWGRHDQPGKEPRPRRKPRPRLRAGRRGRWGGNGRHAVGAVPDVPSHAAAQVAVQVAGTPHTDTPLGDAPPLRQEYWSGEPTRPERYSA
jgi:FkbM family methyltransferase